MNDHPPDPLLNEILSGEEIADFRGACLDRALAAVRHHRHARRAIQIGALVFLPILAAAAFLLRQSNPSALAPKPSSQIASQPKTPLTPAVKIINDEELFALFPGGSMALIGKPGHQELVFLHSPAAPLKH